MHKASEHVVGKWTVFTLDIDIIRDYIRDYIQCHWDIPHTLSFQYPMLCRRMKIYQVIFFLQVVIHANCSGNRSRLTIIEHASYGYHNN